MPLNDLFQSLQMFNDGMTQLSTGRAIRGATEQAQQINMNEQDEFKKRQAFTQLGQGLAQQLSGLGADPTRVAQASQSFMPQQLNGPGDFFQQAAMSKGKAADQYRQAGEAIQQDIASGPMNLVQQANVRQQDYSNRTQRLGLLLSAAGAGKDKTGKELPADQVEKISNLETSISNMDSILTDVKKNPELVGLNKKFTDADWLQNPASRNDPDFASFKMKVTANFDSYRKEITGAGASEGELAMLKKAQPTETDSPAQFVAKMQTALDIAEQVRARKLTNFGRAKYDMSSFSADPISKFGLQQSQARQQQNIDEAKFERIKNLSPNNMTPEMQMQLEAIKNSRLKGKL